MIFLYSLRKHQKMSDITVNLTFKILACHIYDGVNILHFQVQDRMALSTYKVIVGMCVSIKAVGSVTCGDLQDFSHI